MKYKFYNLYYEIFSIFLLSTIRKKHTTCLFVCFPNIQCITVEHGMENSMHIVEKCQMNNEKIRKKVKNAVRFRFVSSICMNEIRNIYSINFGKIFAYFTLIFGFLV